MSEPRRRSRSQSHTIEAATPVLRGLLSSNGDGSPSPKLQRRNLEDLLELILNLTAGQAHLNVDAAFKSAKENHQLVTGAAG